MSGNLIIKNASELVTCKGCGPKAGAMMSQLDVIEDGAIVIENGLITKVGKTSEILSPRDEAGNTVIDARGKSVLPGFVDSHTHFVFAGYREQEFSWRLQGRSYMDILKQGGGILSTVEKTRQASFEQLYQIGMKRLDSMLRFGITTVEGKSGYGLDHDTEIKQLQVMKQLNQDHPVDVIPTFLGAHAMPKSFSGKKDDYIDFIEKDVLPEVAEAKLAEFCDVFCEQNVFSVRQAKQLLSRAKSLGLKLKLHADEMVSLGGAELAAQLKAVSADHLLKASDKGITDMATAGVCATLLPATAFCLKEEFARAGFIIEQNCPVALATDFNPGSSFTGSIPLVMALATLYMGMTSEQVITALTINGAAAVDRADRIGSLEPGKKGDVIILEFPSYLFIPYHVGVNIVQTVIKAGQVVFDRAEDKNFIR